ncbi:restriction endonuclease subunit S [Raineyella sp. LH-20]|uniref:restriction endonuclease subunit S n=1 Tax=Raineyella sp. LH-20 TaxID=3081204 RepID=UPI0029530070|nr:restriction endonuclease subunit S [Raineyella sp. LH-20]WOP17468.1 restriction endonuclease subunit S [Raineyella sp. LH-20]
MKTVALGEIAEVVSGATPKTGVAEFWDGDVEWATPADLSKLDGAYISTTPRKITQAGVRSCATTILPKGSVLLSSRAPIGHVAINTVPMATNQGFKSLVPGPGLDAKYLYHWLRSKTDYLQSLGNGATFKELSRKTTEKIPVPLPSLTEQRRIAAILDQADALRTKRRQVLAHLDSLTQAMFHDMFGDPVTNSRGLPTAAIGDLAEVVTGNSPSRAEASNFGQSIEWIKSDNLGGDTATRADEWLSEHGRARARIAPTGSILVTCIAGSPTSIGKASLVDRDVAFNQQINAILPSPRVMAAFLLGQLKVSPQLVRAKSTGGMKGLVNKSSFQSIRVLYPTSDSQHEFAQRVAAMTSQRSIAARALTYCEELFASLQSRAFRGDL